MTTDSPKPLRWFEYVLALVVAGLAVWLCLFPALRTQFRVVLGDSGDARLIQLVLETGYQALLGHMSVFDPPFFSPTPHVGGFTDNLLGLQPLYVPLRLVLSPHAAFQALMVLATLLNVGLFFGLLRTSLRVDGVPALIGAALFAFGTPRLAQMNHPQLFFQGWALVALLGAAKLMQGGDAKWAIALVGGIVGQLYASWYHGWFLCFGLGLAFMWSLALRPLRAELRATLVRSWKWLLGSGIVGALVLVPFVRTALLAAKNTGWRSFSEAEGMLPRAMSWVYQTPYHFLYGKLFANVDLPMAHEHVMGVGLITSVLIIVALVSGARRPLVAVLGLLLISVLVLTFYWHGTSAWALVFKLVPGAKAVRAVTRVGVEMLIIYGLVLAVLAQRLKVGWQVLMLIIVSAEQGMDLSGYEAKPVIERQQRLVAAIPESCTTFFAYARSGEPYDLQIDAMWAALSSGKRTINGYSGAEPFGWHLFQAIVKNDDELNDLKKRLGEWEVQNNLAPESVCVVEAPR